MLKKRLIPKLLIKTDLNRSSFNSYISKGYDRYSVTGRADKQAQILCDNKADEILFIDLGSKQDIDLKTYLLRVGNMIEGLVTPISFAGNIRTLKHGTELIRVGIEKIVVPYSHSKKFKEFCEQISSTFGRQALQVVLDYKKVDETYRLRLLEKELTIDDIRTIITDIEKLGAGELHLFDMDADGRRDGLDLKTINLVREQTTLPIMISGGANSPEDFVKAFNMGADAIGSGTYFAKMDNPLLQLRSRIWNSGISIRHQI